MAVGKTDREILEALMIDVAVIKDKAPLLERIDQAVQSFKMDCARKHAELGAAEMARLQKCGSRFAALESARSVAEALGAAKDSWSHSRKVLFWSGVVAVATAAQVATAALIHLWR